MHKSSDVVCAYLISLLSITDEICAETIAAIVLYFSALLIRDFASREYLIVVLVLKEASTNTFRSYLDDCYFRNWEEGVLCKEKCVLIKRFDSSSIAVCKFDT